MGKNKSQRTKNNARPSNSSRSAELLGSSASGFVGFTAAKDGGYVPLLPGLGLANSSEITNVEPEFQLAFKKMNKKDATTKFKALQEFSDLCSNSDLSVVENVLPFWPRLYCILTTDIDHRVREAVQIAHAALVKRVGRIIATCLKQLAGPWFVAQYDVYPPAASAATNSFNNTFPSHKFVSAIIHCQDEILNYICDNIIVLTPQALSTNKSLTSEEMDAKYERIISSSLQAYSFYLKTVTPVNIEKTTEYHKKIISNNKFWKLAKHESPAVKTGFFNLLTGFISHTKNIVCEEKKRVLTTVMNGLDETEPALLRAVWEALLMAVNQIEDWHKVISIEKLVLPKLWKVLKNGGQTCACVIYPNLLPFLSHFMKFDINKVSLLNTFFENMRMGFSAKSVKFNRTEALAIVTSYVECFKYAILVNCTNEDICNNLLKEQLMSVIESCLMDNNSMRSFFFCELSRLLRYWSRNSTNKEYPVYSKLLNIFWFELLSMFNRLVDNSIENSGGKASSIITSMTDLLNDLKKVSEYNKSKMKVKFIDIADDSTVKSTESLPSVSVSEKIEEDQFLKELQQFMIKLCVNYFERINEKPLKYKIINLVKIISGHESKELFVALAKIYSKDANLLEFYNKNLKSLIKTENEDVDALINLIFGMASYMKEDDKLIVLDSFKEADDVRILKTAVLSALAPKFREDPTVKTWCGQAVITNTLVLTAQEILSLMELSSFDEKILIQAFEPALNGDLIVHSQAICGISALLSLTVDRISSSNGKKAHRIANLLARLLTLAWTHKSINPGAHELLKALFRLHVRDSIEKTEENTDSDAAKVAQKAWTEGLQEISKRVNQDTYIQIIKYFSSIIWDKLYQVDFNKGALIQLAKDFAHAIIKSSEKYSQKFVVIFMTELDIKKWMQHASGLIFFAEIISGNLYASSLKQKIQTWNEVCELNLNEFDFEDNTHKCMKWALMSTRILNNLLEMSVNLPDVTDTLVNIFYVSTLGEVYAKHFSSSKYANEVNDLKVILQNEMGILKTYLSEDVHSKVIDKMNLLFYRFGGIYVYILKSYCAFFNLSPKFCFNFDNDEPITKESATPTNILLQSVQVFDNSSNLEEHIIIIDNDIDFFKIFLARNHLRTTELIERLDDIFSRISKLQQQESMVLLLDCEVGEVSWESFNLPLESINFFTRCINSVPKELTISHWDTIEICLASWSLTVKKTLRHHKDFKVKALIVAVNKLYNAFQTTMNKHSKRPMEELPPSLLDEWNNVFASDLQDVIFDTWVNLIELYNVKDVSLCASIPLSYLGKSLQAFNEPIIKTEKSETSASEDKIIALLLKLIHSPVLNLQLGAYILLSGVANVFVDRDKAIIVEEDSEEKLLNICTFENVLKTSQNVVNTILSDFKLCDTLSCTIQPHTDSYTYTIGYLLTWDIILKMCAKAHGDLRYRYAEILKDDYFPSLLNNLFRLMPIEVLQEKNNAKLVEIFTTIPSCNFEDNWTERRLDHLVCWLYTSCLRYLPVRVREWWNTTDSRVSSTVDRITTAYVSPFLCNTELQNEKMTSIDNMQIKIHQSAREVVALYQMGDTRLELNIIVPPNYPLGTVTVEPGMHVGGTANWRISHMQLSIFLTHQNGSIWDGLMLWKANLDKKYAGVEECYICFSIFHISTYQIPTLSCQACRKKFHKPCLYKWFRTSQKSTCPICRNVF